MTTPEILRQAAQEIRKGWTKYTLVDDDGNVCANGAICCALTGSRRIPYFFLQHREHIESFKAANRALADVVHGDVPMWNNADDQTAENVAATMELAAICFEQAQEQATATNAVDPVPQIVAEGLRA